MCQEYFWKQVLDQTYIVENQYYVRYKRRSPAVRDVPGIDE